VMLEQIGGDFYDFFEPSHESPDLFVCIGDVAGHGLSAAIVVAMASAGVRLLVESGERDPARMLEKISLLFLAILGKVKMMTFPIASIDAGSGESSPLIGLPSRAVAGVSWEEVPDAQNGESSLGA